MIIVGQLKLCNLSCFSLKYSLIMKLDTFGIHREYIETRRGRHCQSGIPEFWISSVGWPLPFQYSGTLTNILTNFFISKGVAQIEFQVIYLIISRVTSLWFGELMCHCLTTITQPLSPTRSRTRNGLWSRSTNLETSLELLVSHPSSKHKTDVELFFPKKKRSVETERTEAVSVTEPQNSNRNFMIKTWKSPNAEQMLRNWNSLHQCQWKDFGTSTVHQSR